MPPPDPLKILAEGMGCAPAIPHPNRSTKLGNALQPILNPAKVPHRRPAAGLVAPSRWAQVRGAPAADLAETRVKLGYDLFYLKHLSFSLDLQILLRTIWTLVAGGGVR